MSSLSMRSLGRIDRGFATLSLLMSVFAAAALGGCGGQSDTESGDTSTTTSGTTTGTTAATTSAGTKMAGSTAGGTTAASSGAATTGKSDSGSQKTYKIAVIPKGTTHEFWKSVHAGAVRAQQALQKNGYKVDILWHGPLEENDRNSQVSIVQTFIQQKVDGIVLAPLDAQALVSPVDEAASANIPVVIIDSGLSGQNYASFVATDNKKGGTVGGQELGKLLNGKGHVIMMRYQEGSASTDDREAGFMEAMKAFPGISMLSNNQYGGATVESAYKTGQNLVNRYSKQIDGIFTPNESTTRGMRKALQDAGLLGKVKFVGFDASEDLIAALKAREIQGLVLQSPVRIGEEGVLTVFKAIQKQPIEKRVNTGVYLATPENMNQPDIKSLLYPPLAQYLKES